MSIINDSLIVPDLKHEVTILWIGASAAGWTESDEAKRNRMILITIGRFSGDIGVLEA